MLLTDVTATVKVARQQLYWLSKRQLTTALNGKYNLEIVVSHSTSPYFNLAFEDYLFKNFPVYTKDFIEQELPKKILFMYCNTQCVVIGRNQNPWKETNVIALRNHHIPLIRRKSGGGTVFHDTGNVNYCVMVPATRFNRDEHALALCEALNPGLEIAFQNEVGKETKSLRVNERHDIVNQDNKKVSGSAYKLQKGKSYHHGTMLLNSRLDVLRNLLHKENTLESITGAGVESVKSPVANIGVTSDDFIQATALHFWHLYSSKSSNLPAVRYVDETSITDTEKSEIATRQAEFHSWEWTFSSTPKFSHTFLGEDNGDLKFSVNSGKISDIETTSQEIEASKNSIIGLHYRGDEIARYIKSNYWSQRIKNSI
ncbi:hypothetical protein V1514DRAFT_277536 [Lipomyces japonicus]|uniref:uncharacterized protein n=1 Tax=Lipomyces japonicus TaxID=56871 RepID=UPI0034CE0BB5